MRKISLAILGLILLAAGGVKRFDILATRPMDPSHFSKMNKLEIYAGYLAIMTVGYPLYPEISKEMWYMLFPSSEDREIVFKDDFFIEDNLSYVDLFYGASLTVLDYINELNFYDLGKLKNLYSIVKSRPSFKKILADRVVGVNPHSNYLKLDY